MKSKSPDNNLKLHGKGRSKVNKSGMHIKSSTIFFHWGILILKYEKKSNPEDA